MKKIHINKKEGIMFWITGLAGSGKSSIARALIPKIKKKYGPTILVSGDNLRNIFKERNYTILARKKFAKKKAKFCKFILSQKINIVYSTISLLKSIRKENKKNFRNYVEIYIESNLEIIKNLGKKKIYHKKNQKNVWGIDLKPEFPTSPNIKIKNSFKESASIISNKIYKKINKLLIN